MIKQYVSITPGNRISIAGFKGDKIEKELTIISLEDQPLMITDVTSTIDDKIKYELNTKKEGEEYILEVKNRSGKQGMFRGQLVLKTNSEKKPYITIPVYINLKGDVDVKPGAISFGTIHTNNINFKTTSLRRSIVLRDARGKGLTIKKVKTSSDWIMVETKTRKGGKQYIIEITLDKDKLPMGQFEEKIKIRTNYQRKYLEVDIKGKVI